MYYATSTIVWFKLYATFFCFKIYGVEVGNECFENSIFLEFSWLNFPPLSILKVLILPPICFSTNALNSLNFEKYFTLFFRMKYFWKKSSMKDTKYLIPPKDSVLDGPQTFVWMNLNNLFVHDTPSFGNASLCYFPYTWPSQNMNSSL